MATPPLITPDPITDEQRDLIIQFAGVAARKAIETQNLTAFRAKNVIARYGEFEARLVAIINALSLKLPDLGCFTIADWENFYSIVMTAEPPEFPWVDATLNSLCLFHRDKMVRETHFAFLGVDTVTMMEFQKLNPAIAAARYLKQEFATKTALAFRWYLLLKDIVPGSEGKTFGEQEAMLPIEYEAPSAVVETAKDILIYKKTGTYVNSLVYARTADLDSDGLRVRVGCCHAGCVQVKSGWNGRRGRLIGIGASRKLDQNLAA